MELVNVETHKHWNLQMGETPQQPKSMSAKTHNGRNSHVPKPKNDQNPLQSKPTTAKTHYSWNPQWPNSTHIKTHYGQTPQMLKTTMAET